MAVFCNSQVHAGTPLSPLDQAFNKGRFFPPAIEELQQVRLAYKMELAGQAADSIWQTLNMQRISKQQRVYLHEKPENRSGKGLFAINPAMNLKPWLLQAPHDRSDKYTGKIVEQIFSEGHFKSAMWNTVHRKTVIENGFETKADMAHLHDTYWQAVTESFAQTYNTGRVIQLHGFKQSKRKTASARNSDVIISAGHRYPPRWVLATANCLKESFPATVSLYPYDVKELGATTNVQGQLLRDLGFNGFLHIELSQPIRQKLLQKQSLRLALIKCIQ